MSKLVMNPFQTHFSINPTLVNALREGIVLCWSDLLKEKSGFRNGSDVVRVEGNGRGQRRGALLFLACRSRHVPGSIALSFIFAEVSLVLNIRFSNTFLSQMKLRPVYIRYICTRAMLSFQQNTLSWFTVGKI